MNVILFDIDGTLVDTGGAGRRAIERAAFRLHGREDLFQDIAFDGMTDRAICRAALEKLGEVDEDEIDALLSAYVELLEDEVARTPRYRIYPGVTALVGELAAAGALQGLGTGNVERGARVKLERGGLNPAFRFGGFGSDAEDRGEVLRAGLARAAALTSEAVGRTWVVGDTPRDLSAARKIGAWVVLVATGRYRAAELTACGPELCVETLEDPRVAPLLLQPGY